MKIDKYANFVKLTFKSEKEYKDYIDLLEKNLGSYINASFFHMLPHFPLNIGKTRLLTLFNLYKVLLRVYFY